MATQFQPVIDPKTNQATGLYFGNGSYYKFDPALGYTQVANPNAGGVAQSIDQKLGTSRSAQNDNEKLVDQIFGQTPTGYSGAFDTAFQNAGQPAGQPHGNKVIEGTQALADAYVERYHLKTGKLPTEDEVRQFVASNLTPGMASQFIAGINRDQLTANYVDPYLQDKGVGQDGGNAQDRILGLNAQLDEAYNTGKTKFLEDTNTNYGQQKQGLVNDLAGQGMLTQPNSRVSLDALEAAKNKDVASGLNTLAGQRAAGSVDLGKTIEGLLQSQQQINNNQSQFNKTFNAGREDTYFNQGLQNRQLSLADTLGRLQANASKPGALDFLNTAIGGAGAVANAYTGAKSASALTKLLG